MWHHEIHAKHAKISFTSEILLYFITRPSPSVSLTSQKLDWVGIILSAFVPITRDISEVNTLEQYPYKSRYMLKRKERDEDQDEGQETSAKRQMSRTDFDRLVVIDPDGDLDMVLTHGKLRVSRKALTLSSSVFLKMLGKDSQFKRISDSRGQKGRHWHSQSS